MDICVQPLPLLFVLWHTYGKYDDDHALIVVVRVRVGKNEWIGGHKHMHVSATMGPGMDRPTARSVRMISFMAFEGLLHVQYVARGRSNLKLSVNVLVSSIENQWRGV